MRNLSIPLTVASLVLLLVLLRCSPLEKKLLYYPTHHSDENGLKAWYDGATFLGYSRGVQAPKNIWLMLHGNAGQASDRAYALPSFSSEDSVFILEYPGYGKRSGRPSKKALNQAAQHAFLYLRKSNPGIPVCVVGESIGSGPAASLAAINPPPEKLVLIVPFDRLPEVAKQHFPSLLVFLLLKDNWDNIAALKSYLHPVDIFGAAQDRVIPVSRAKALADAVPSSRFILIQGGHNDWSYLHRVKIRNP